MGAPFSGRNKFYHVIIITIIVLRCFWVGDFEYTHASRLYSSRLCVAICNVIRSTASKRTKSTRYNNLMTARTSTLNTYTYVTMLHEPVFLSWYGFFVLYRAIILT